MPTYYIMLLMLSCCRYGKYKLAVLSVNSINISERGFYIFKAYKTKFKDIKEVKFIQYIL